MRAPERQKSENDTVTDYMLIEYLQRNPDFFNKYPAVIANMRIPHAYSGTVSLIERQISILREQNRHMQKHLHELFEIARQNEKLARRMHKLALILMDAAEPQDVFDTIYDSLKKDFHADRAVVRLFAEPASTCIFNGDEFVGTDVPEKKLFKTIIDKCMPLSGRLKRRQQAFLFGDDDNELASAVMVPLHGNGWGGILAIGSFDPQHFQPCMGVELLGNFGEVLSFILKPWIKS